MYKFVSILLFSFTLLLVTCKHEPTEPPLDPNNNTVPTNPVPDSVCFNTQIMPLFSASCAMTSGCHNATNPQKGLVLTSYLEIKTNLKDIMEEIEDGKMPYNPYPKLDAATINLLKRWINEGATERNCSATVCDTTLVKYTTHIAPLMVNYCRGCHNAASAGGNVKLDTYDNVKANVQTPGKVICAITANGCTLMPKGGSSIGFCNIRKIQIWAENNFPN